MTDDLTRTRILALLYPVQFEKQPEQGIDRVIRKVIGRSLQSSEADYIEAITSALAGTDPLSTILPSPYLDEETVRNYLRSLREKLQSNQ